MEPRTASRIPAPNDLAKTLRFRREEITTEFTREPIDADDTVPVELYSRPYERLEIERESSPYERIEIELVDAADVPVAPVHHAPSTSVRLFFAFSILCLTFTLGVAFAFLLL